MRHKKLSKFRKRFRGIGVGISLALSLIIGAAHLISQPEFNFIRSTGLLEIIEAKTLDLRFQLRGARSPGSDIVIVAMDEKTEDELGRWQTAGRRWIAQMVAKLSEEGAAVIGFDVALAEPDENTALQAIDALKRRCAERASPHIPPDVFEEARAAYDYDRQLAEAIERAGNVVLGVYHFLNQADAAHLSPKKRAANRELLTRMKYETIKFPPGDAPQPLRITHSFGVETNLPLFSAAARSFGHFTIIPDTDGYVRQSPLLIELEGAYYPSLDLEIARARLQLGIPPMIHALGEKGGGSVTAIQFGALAIPTNAEGKLLINYYGPPRAFPYYSLSDVLRGAFPPGAFQGKIALFGFTSSVYQDVHSASFQAKTYPGVEVHATILANILHQDFLTQPAWTMFAEAGIIVLLGLFLGIALFRLRTLAGAAVSLLSLLAVAGSAYFAFAAWQVWLNVTVPGLFILLNYLVMISYKYVIEEKEKRDITNAFQHYIAPSVVAQIIERGENLTLQGEEKVLTALFSDIRGFTNLTEKMEQKALVPFLDEYFAEMNRIVFNYAGTIDKYIGDAMMVFYGAPIEQADHAARACRTAVDMILRLEELRVRWKARGLPQINIGVGVNSGEMTVGNIGSADRLNYTIMGDHVNLASRLEGVNKEYGTRIIISQFTHDLIRHADFTARELDSVRVKGKEKPVTIYELLGYGAFYQHKQPLISAFAEGAQAYKQRDWERALAAFQEALRLDPNDQPSNIYLARCQAYQQHPPPDDWDGVFVMKSK